MSISFSGLGSGIDTSSWVTALTNLKQAKVTTLQEKRSNVVTLSDTVNNIKSFFSSFRSMVEKVTDSRFSIASSDLFAKKTAISSRSNVATASVTSEAQEGTYKLRVNQLATSTKATSVYTATETTNKIAETTTRLSELGVNSGTLDITVNGMTKYNAVTIDSNTTLGGFIQQMNSAGADTSFNSVTGELSLGISTSNITAHDTNVISKLGLSDVSNIYCSNLLNTSSGAELANGSTKLSAVGIEAGTFTIKNDDGETYDIELDIENDDFDALIEALDGAGVTAGITDGRFHMDNASITAEGTTRIISALHLEDTVSSTNVTSAVLSYQDTTSPSAISTETTLEELGLDGDSYSLVVKNSANNIVSTQDFGKTTTLGEIQSFLSNSPNHITMNIVNTDGVYNLTFDSGESGDYIDTEASTLAQALGIGENEGSSINLTTDPTRTSSSPITVSSPIDWYTNISDVVSNADNRYLIIRGLNDELVASIDASGTNYNFTSLSADLASHSMKITMNNGVISITDSSVSGGGYHIDTTLGMAPDLSLSSSSNGIGTIWTPATTASVSTTLCGVATGSSSLENICIISNFVSAVNEATAVPIIVTDAASLAAALTTYTTIGIANADVLAQLATLVNSGTDCSGKTIVLTDDIDLSDYGSSYNSGKGWTAIGNNSNGFKGTFDGNGHVVSNLYINNTTSVKQGLFGCTNWATTIRNVGVEACNVTGGDYTGGLVGYADATIQNCYVTGSVSGIGTTGGLVGYAPGTIQNCYASGSVSGGSETGGLVGDASGTIQNCYASGSVTGGVWTGGLVGDVGPVATITGSTSYATAVSGGTGVGCFAGNISSSATITDNNCINISGLSKVGNTTSFDSNIGYATLADMPQSTCEITISNNKFNTSPATITLSATTTLDELVAALNSHSITASFTNGTLSITQTEDNMITSDVSGILAALGFTGQMVANSSNYTKYTAATSNGNITHTVTANGSTAITALSSATLLGKTISVMNCATGFSFTVGSSSTINDLLDFLTDTCGFTQAYIDSDGILHTSVAENSGIYIKSIDSDLATALGINMAQLYNTNLVTTTVNTASDELSSQVVPALGGTTLEQLGVTGSQFNITIGSDTKTVNYSSGTTLDQLVGLINAQVSGLASFDESTHILTLNGSGNISLNNGDGNLVTKLFGNNPTTEYLYNYTSTSDITYRGESITEDTKLSVFNTDDKTVEGQLKVSVGSDLYSLEITSNTKISDLINYFNRMDGVSAEFEDDRISINGGMNEITIGGTGTTSDLVDLLGLTQSGYGYCVSDPLSYEIYEQLSVTKYAELDTKLTSIGITQGSFTVYNGGTATSVNIGENTTLEDINTYQLAGTGLSASINDGLITFSSTTGKNVTLTSGTSNFVNTCMFDNNILNNDGSISANRKLFMANGNSKIMSEGIFNYGTVTEGKFKLGDAEFTIDSDTTINGLISQINKSDKSGVTAYWDSSSGNMILTSRTTGATPISVGTLSIGESNLAKVMGFKLEDNSLNFDAQEFGTNAEFSLDGNNYTSITNTVIGDTLDDAYKGITLNLKNVMTADDEDVVITVEHDTESLTSALSDIVDSYNTLMDELDEELASSGSLSNQSALKMLRTQIRSIMTGASGTNSKYSRLSAIGISTQAASSGNISTTGLYKLSVDTDKLAEAYESDSDAVKALLIGDDEGNDGVFAQLETVLDQALSTTGYFSSQEKSLKKQISNYDNKITKMQESVDRYQEQLEAKFQSMDLLISNLQNQYSSFLSSSSSSSVSYSSFL